MSDHSSGVAREQECEGLRDPNEINATLSALRAGT
jgi:hypothetical protein